jgi:hypothetical protein
MESPNRATHLSPIRRELLNWFRKNAQPLAEAYEGATRLLDARDFPGRLHFISHAVRDISNLLVFVLDPQVKRSQVDYANEMDWIGANWPNIEELAAVSESEASSETVAIDYKVAAQINSLVKSHRDSRQRPSNYELLFQFLMRKEPTHAEVNLRLVSDFKKIYKWFMSRAHFRHQSAPDIDEDELQAQFGRFEGMLHSFAGEFFTGTAEIDEVLRQANQ